MKSKVENLSALIDTQLPNFILSEYPNFAAFLQKYYEYLELPGNPVDLINNLTKYRDVDTYEKRLLKETTNLSSQISSSTTSIPVLDTSSFPEENGYILIDDEVIFYKSKTANTFQDCYRNVNSTVKLGDLYFESTFKEVPYDEVGNGVEHNISSSVLNVTNLFLYALVKNFESEYLGPFPENLLRQQIDKSLFIKNIKTFYASKGTQQSVSFIFNALVNQEEDTPTIYYPKDSTIKASGGEWSTKFCLYAKLISGDPQTALGSRLTQNGTAFGIIDAIRPVQDGFCEISFAPQSVVGQFKIASKTILKTTLSETENEVINVDSTVGFDSNRVLINDEIIVISSKNVRQFFIDERGDNPSLYDINTEVYQYLPSFASGVEFIIFGLVKNFKITDTKPYSQVGDSISELQNTFESKDPIVFNYSSNSYRWIINNDYSSPSSLNLNITNSVDKLLSNVSAIYQDENYFYIASSGYPGYSFGKSSWSVSPFVDNKNLKVIPKKRTETTTIYETLPGNTGIFINGCLIYNYKDTEVVEYGEIVDIEVTNKGQGYLNPPSVVFEDIINTTPAKAKAILSGEVVDKISIVNSGEYKTIPAITITSGRNAVVSPVITLGRVTSLKIVNPGEYYTTPPEIIVRDLNGNGRFARYTAKVKNGKLTGFTKQDEGKFYNPETTIVEVVSVGSGATAVATVKKWRKDSFAKYASIRDSSNGIYYVNNQDNYSYANIADPLELRNFVSDTGASHSPILGFAYDGNPIYGPYGYVDATDNTSGITRMTSSYVLNSSRIKGPSKNTYPLGSFIDDYTYDHRSGSLDENNGRFCVTPDYPEGTYAYFITINQQGNPVFPYIIGENYYSLPTTINYDVSTTQDKLPSNVKRLNSQITAKNGKNTSAFINEVYSGGISGITGEDNAGIFSVGNDIITNESTVNAKVSRIKGKSVETIEGRETKAIRIHTRDFCYLYDGDIITQEQTNASGEIVGDVFDGNVFVVRNVSGVFNLTDKLFSETEVVSAVLDIPSSFTSQSILRLVNGKKCIIKSVSTNKLNVSVNPFVENEPVIFTNSFSQIQANTIYYVVDRKIKSFKIATTPGGSPLSLTDNATPSSVAEGEKGRAIVLETTSQRNNVKIQITDGVFEQDDNYYLLSSTLTDSSTSKVIDLLSLSSDIEISKISDNIALVKTTEEHGISEGDLVTVDIEPDDSTTETTYYVRKRAYQKVKISSPDYSSFIQDTGIGRLTVLNNGSYFDTLGDVSGEYANGLSDTFTNVELIFLDQSNTRVDLGKPGDANNATATISVTNGVVTNINIQNKGSGYIKGDLLTVSDQDLDRLSPSVSSNYLTVEVDHVGFAKNQTTLTVGSTLGVSQNDFLRIGTEIVQVTSISSSKNLVVIRGQQDTENIDHFNSTEVILSSSNYNLSKGYQPNNSYIIEEYNSLTNEILVSYPINYSLNTRNKLFKGTNFSDESTPEKLVSVEEVIEEISYKFEFSTDEIVWEKNPNLLIQNNYKYNFDLSSSSLRGVFFELSPSNNFNIFTVESDISSILPGNAGSYYKVKFGFGSNISSNSYENKKDLLYNVYFYFDKNGVVGSDGGLIKINIDPLQGNHIVNYTSSVYFSYDLLEIPAYDGSGIISYTTNSSTASGYIDQIEILNPGKNLTKLPIISGGIPSTSNQCTVSYTVNNGAIDAIFITNPGKNYVKPEIYISNTSGSNAKFDIIKNNDGSISSIRIVSGGKGYTKNAILLVIETDVELYAYSNIIGKPKSVIITQNGFDFNSDFSYQSKYSSKTILSLKNISFNNVFPNQIFEQYKDGVLLASGLLESWSKGSNIIRLSGVVGKFEEGLEIINDNGDHALVTKEFTSIFTPEITSSAYIEEGYVSNKSHLSNKDQKLADSYFYQDYSYVIKSKTPMSRWRSLILDTIHPAGFKLFGNIEVNSSAEIIPPQIRERSSFVSVIQLNTKISVEKVTKNNVISLASFGNSQEQRGKGLVASPYVDTSDTISYDLQLSPAFDGYYNESGNRQGTKTFTIQLKGSTTALSVSNPNNLILSLDGILQNNQTAFSISGNQITFTEAPLGYRTKSGASVLPVNYISGVDVPAQNFAGRFISIKNEIDNSKLFKKIKDISNQFDGIKTQFDLYYDDNTPCLLEAKENLFINIDGILQRAGETPLFPYDRSYYIVKTSSPNKLVFNEPPKADTQFNGYSIGNYARLKLAEKIDEVNNQVFSLKTELDELPFIVDNERNLLVFIDGVLQVRGESYTFVSNYIRFREKLDPDQKIYMLFCYGKDSERSITVFNHTDRSLNKVYTIRINTIGFTTISKNQYLTGSKIASVDNSTNTTIESTEATIREFKHVIGDTWDIVLSTRFNQIDPTKITRVINFFDIQPSEIISVSDYQRDVSSPYPRLSTYDSQNYEYLEEGDKIRIDGEISYRNVLNTPTNPISYDNSAYSIKFATSNNNDIIPGVSIVLDAEILNGSVNTLKYNAKTAPNYLAQTSAKIVTKADLIFVPQPVLNDGGDIVSLPAGSGASGYVLFNDITVAAIVITNGGSGYLTPPKVFVALGFDIKKSPKNLVKRQIKSSFVSSGIQPFALNVTPIEVTKIFSGFNLIPSDYVVSIEGFGSGTNYARIRWAPGITNNFVGVTGLARRVKIAGTFLDPANDLLNGLVIGTWNLVPETFNLNNNFVDISLVSFVPIGIYDVSQVNEPEVDFYVTTVGRVLDVNGITYTNLNTGNFGQAIIKQNDPIVSSDIRSSGRQSFGEFIASAASSVNIFTKFGYYLPLISPAFAEPITRRISFGGSAQTTPIASVTDNSKSIVTIQNVSYLNNTRLYVGQSVNYTSVILQIDLNQTDTIAYVANTDNFAPSGYLLIGREIVYYSSKISDRFIISERGAYNTPAEGALAGTLVRQYEPDLSNIDTSTATTLIPYETFVSATVASVQLQPITLSIVNKVSGGENTAVFGGEVRIERDATVIDVSYINVSLQQPITVSRVDQSVNVGVVDILRQSDIIRVGGRQEDLAIDLAPVFGGVANAFTVETDLTTSSIIPDKVFADTTVIQEITVTPRIDTAIATISDIVSIVVETDIDKPLTYETEIKIGVATISAINESRLTSSIVVQPTLVDTVVSQQITVFPPVDPAVATVINITTTNAYAETIREAVFIQTDQYTASYVGNELSVDISYEFTPIIVPKIFVDTTLSAEINLIAQVVIPQESVFDITPNEVVANDINNIQIYRTIETGLGSNGDGVAINGEYPYQSELTNVTPTAIINSTTLDYQIGIDNTTIIPYQQITVIIPPQVASVGIDSIITVETTIDKPIAYEPTINAGVVAVINTTEDTNITTSVIQSVFVDTIIIPEIRGVYETLRTSQTTLLVDREPLLSPVAIFVDDAITDIDKPVTAQYVPIEPIAFAGVVPTVLHQITVRTSTGVLDYYQETLYLNSDIITRNDGTVNITSTSISTRSDGTINARNLTRAQQFDPYGTYGIASMMNSYEIFEQNAFYNNTGVQGTVVNTTFNEVDAARIQLDEFTINYPSVTIEDFELRANSRISIAGDELKFGIPTYTSSDLGADRSIDNHKIIDPTP